VASDEWFSDTHPVAASDLATSHCSLPAIHFPLND